MKHIQPAAVVHNIPKIHLDKNRFHVLERSKEIARKTLGQEPEMFSLEMVTARLSDGLRHDVAQVTWIPLGA